MIQSRRCQAIAFLITVTTAVSLFGTPLRAQDTITLDRSTRRGSKLLGTITEVSPTEITISSSGGERKVPVNEVQRIGLGGEPTGLRQARNAVLAGQYEQALERLDEVGDVDLSNDVLRQEIGFYRVLAKAKLALLGGGDPKAAESAMMDFLRKERSTYHFFEIAEILGDLANAGGDYRGAARYYQQLAKAPWPEYELRSYVLMGGALRSQGNCQEAIEQYDRALAGNVSDPIVVRQQVMARIGKLSCQAEQGEIEEAVGQLEEIVSKNDPADEELFAQAYLALGAAYRQANQPVDAVLAYLHVDLLFYGQRAAHAESLYYLTELWPQIDQPARAIDARQLLQSRYPGTIWAKRAG